MTKTSDSIILRLEGARATRGVALSDFETFIENFLAALRDFDRDRRGTPTRKAGAPEGPAAMVSAFRLIDFRPGSGIATIEPDVTEGRDATEAMVDAEPAQVANLCAMLAQVEEERDLPPPVTESLQKACRTLGVDGSITVDMGRLRFGSRKTGLRRVVIDTERLERISRQVSPPPSVPKVETISGLLHQVDFEPDKLAIRVSDGVDWVCEFPEELVPKVETMVNRLVWARGRGALQSPRRGTMKLAEIKRIEQGTQTDLFTQESIPEEQLAADQGVRGPQGLDALSAPEWTEADDAYLAALTED